MEMCCQGNYGLSQVKEVVIIIDGNIISNDNSYWVFRQGDVLY